MQKILLEQSTASCGIRHDPIPAAFGGLRTNAKRALGRINIIGPESAKFLAPQCRIVGECEHRPVADSLSTRGCENRLPVCFVGNPWQPAVSPHEAPSISAHYRVRSANSFLYQVAIEQSEDSDALLDGGIRNRDSVGLHRPKVRADV